MMKLIFYIIWKGNWKASCKYSFKNNLQANIKLSKAQISKVIQSVGFLGRLLGALMEVGLPVMKNVVQPLA